MSEAEQGPRVGTLLAGRFRVLEVIGKGGMGIVVRAIDQLTGSEVAVKHVRPDLAEDPDYAERLLREAQLARDVSHHNVCRVHDVYSHGNEVLLSMEYVQGETLRKRLDRGPLRPDEALHIARQVCAGVAAAHKKGVVHRDLKPENVLIDASGRVVVLDFGVARKEGSPRDTVTGIALGTPRYMSPEQQQGKAVTPKTDVFALGLVIEELYGEKPPGWLRPIIRRATERDPGRRYPDAEALGQKLGRPWLRAPLVGLALGSGVVAAAMLALLLHPPVVTDIGRALPLRWRGAQKGAAEPREPSKVLLSRQWGGAQLATLSPDGKLLAYLEESEGSAVGLLRPLRDKNGQIHRFSPGGQSVNWISFSPDSRYIAYSTGRNMVDRAAEIYIVEASLSGAPSTRRITAGNTPSWFPDGKTLAISHYNEETGRWHLSRIAASGDAHQSPIEADPPARYELCPAVSPDGKRLAYLAGPTPGGLRVLPVDGGTAITLDDAPSFYDRVQWTPDSKRIIYGADRGLLSIEARLQGQVGTLLPASESAHSPSLTADGRLMVYTRAPEMFDLWMAERHGQRRRTIPVNIETTTIGWPLFSPDGRSIALTIGIGIGINTGKQVALIPLDGSPGRVVSKPRDQTAFPENFVDGGHSLIVGGDRAGGLEVIPLGTAPPPRIEFGPDERDAVVSPDGKRLATTRMEGKEATVAAGLWVRPIGAPPAQAVCWVEDGFGRPTWSPDGEMVAVGTSKGMVAVSSGPGRTRRLNLTDPQGAPLRPRSLHFASDGALLIAQHPRIYEVDLAAEVARPIISPERIINLYGFSVSPDGKELVYVTQPLNSDLWLLESPESLLIARH